MNDKMCDSVTLSVTPLVFERLFMLVLNHFIFAFVMIKLIFIYRQADDPTWLTRKIASRVRNVLVASCN